MKPAPLRTDYEASELLELVRSALAQTEEGQEDPLREPVAAKTLRALEPRLEQLRSHAARDHAQVYALNEKLDQILADQRELERDARTDPLTGLGNRAAYEEELERLWAAGSDFTVAFIDVDNLKECNDRFGHREGNRCIEQTAFFVSLNKDETEKLFRVGGDEFVFVSPVSGEYALGQRLGDARTMLKRSTSRNGTMPFTFSYGCSRVRPSRGDDAKQMTSDADRKMYSYKLLHRTSYERPSEKATVDDSFVYAERVFEALSMADEGRYFFVCDIEHDYSRWSSNAVHDLGLPAAHMEHAGNVWLDHVHPEDRAAYEADIAAIFAGEKHHHNMQYRARDASGDYVICKCRGFRLEAEGGQPALFVGVIVNRSIAESTDPSTGLGGVNSLVQAIADARERGTSLGVCAAKFDGMGRLNAERGYEIGDRVFSAAASRAVAAARGLGVAYRGRGAQVAFLAPAAHEDDTLALARRVSEACSAPLEVMGETFALPSHIAWLHYPQVDEQPYSVLADIGHQIKLVEDHDHAAKACDGAAEIGERLDAKTGLRRSEDFLAAAQELLEAHRDLSWCLATIDLGNLRIFNEWHGKTEGDLLISQIGAALAGYERIGNCAAGYWGQDDFTLFMPFEAGAAEKVLEQVKAIVARHDESAGFSPSMGVYPVPKDGNVDIDAYSKAFFANRGAKQNFECRINYFRAEDYERRIEEHLILSDFQRAVASGEITFDLQPQVDITTGKIVGAEALARWRFPNGTEASPARFVPVLEKTGFVITLDKIIWRKVVSWQAARAAAGELCVPVSVNVSRIDIVSFDVAEYLFGLIEEAGIPASLVKAEVTESSFVETRGKVAQMTTSLRKRGIEVYMDDFGTGQSSLAMLRAVNVNALKLDRSFLPTELGPGRGAGIVESMTRMARSMDVPIVVEGVETPEQIALLRKAGARYVQGFFCYRPMRPDRFAELLGIPDRADPRGIRKPSARTERV